MAMKPFIKDHKGRVATPQAKEQFLDHLARGATVKGAARMVDRSYESVRYWRKEDLGFDEQIRIILSRRRDAKEFKCPDFPEFCEEYLGQELFWHQLQWWDVLNGDEPRFLHPSQTFSMGDPQMLLFNTPPYHAKSTVFTTNYVTWRICRDSNVRIIIVSATEKMAKKFLYAIKQRLTNPTYSDLQRKFGPQGGFRGTADSWTATEIYLGSKADGEKDPTVQALGMGGQIYGSRADLIIVDDAVLLKNAQHWEDQIDWLTQDVITRLPEGDPDSKLIVAGTRVAPVDMYQKLRDDFSDENGEPVFTYFSQPAVLEYGETPSQWYTLWPETRGRDGQLVPQWDGLKLASRRQKVRPWTWSLVYQQEEASTDGVFDAILVQGACDPRRAPGVLREGYEQRPAGMSGLHVVAGLDPATAGYTAAVVVGIDRRLKKMWVLDCFNQANTSPRQMRDLIERWSLRYAVNEWVIEENAFQRHMVQDHDLRSWLFGRGIVLRGHHTGRNKSDPDLGVASMATLFEPLADGRGTIELPSSHHKYPAVTRLTEQLITWQPDVKVSAGQTDLVMALWFTSIRARQLMHGNPENARSYMGGNQFLNRNRASRERTVIDLGELGVG